MTTILTCFTIISTIFLTSADYDLENLLPIFQNIPEDGRLDFCKLANKYHYKCIRYSVVTEDGYILGLFNIPGDKSKPIFLQHGFLDSSDTFLIRTNLSLVAYLSKQGYDIWLGNARGNKYSRDHMTLSPNALEFWEFSFHEIAIYDLPAMIDFILKKTSQDKLQAIGHSQGTTVFYVLGSMKPEYNSKLSVVICYAPVAYLHNAKKRIFPVISAMIGPVTTKILSLFSQGELLGNSSQLVALARNVCSQNAIGYELCAKKLMFFVLGSDEDQLEPAFFQVALGHSPSGTSTKNSKHELQVASSKEFSCYDYGILKNIVIYKSVTPPKYDLSKVTVNIALVVGLGDKLAEINDVELLREQLPNVVDFYVMKRKEYNHVDFVWARNNTDLFEYTDGILRKYSK